MTHFNPGDPFTPLYPITLYKRIACIYENAVTCGWAIWFDAEKHDVKGAYCEAENQAKCRQNKGYNVALWP